MKNYLFVPVALAALATSAVAADLPNRKSVPAPASAPAPTFDAFGSLAIGYNQWDVGGKLDGLNFDARATFAAPLFASLSFQADGTFARSEFSQNGDTLRRNASSLAGHVFHRNNAGLLGVIVQANVNDTNFLSSRDYFAGVEAQYFLGNFTLYGQAAYQNHNTSIGFFGPFGGISADGWQLAGQLRYFVQPNWMIAVKGAYSDMRFDNFGPGSFSHTAWKVGAKTEYRFDGSPVSVFLEADYREGKFGGFGVREKETRAVLGAKWNFGTQTLIQRDRGGASLDPLQSLLPPVTFFGIN